MALFRLNPAYGIAPELVIAGLSFTDINSPVPSGTSPGSTSAYGNKNQQVNPANIAVALANGGYIGSDASVKPPRNQQIFNVYAYPQGGVAAYTGNNNTINTSLITTTAPTAGEYLIDCSGFQGDIVNADANFVSNARGVTATSNSLNSFQAQVSAIDNVNKFVYVQVFGQATNTGTNPQPVLATGCWPGTIASIHVQIVFCDSYVA
jgi:hypothetical protein